MKNFKELIVRAKCGEHSAREELLRLYHPLLLKESVIDGVYDEDLYQQLCYRFFICIDRFDF